jgi:hypothetical protein
LGKKKRERKREKQKLRKPQSFDFFYGFQVKAKVFWKNYQGGSFSKYYQVVVSKKNSKREVEEWGYWEKEAEKKKLEFSTESLLTFWISNLHPLLFRTQL